MAESVAQQYTAGGSLATLRLTVPVDVPPVGMIFSRERSETAVTKQLVECVRDAARSRRKSQSRKSAPPEA